MRHQKQLWSAAIAVAGSVLLGMSGCAMDIGTAEGEATGTVSQAIGGQWRLILQMPNQTGGFAEGAAVCDAHIFHGGYAVFGRSASTNRIRMSITDRRAGTSNWTDMSTSTFNAKPACAPLDGLYDLPQAQWNFQKAVVARNSSNQYMIRIVSMPPPPFTDPATPITPTVLGTWQSIGTTTYNTAPAVTLASTVFNGQTTRRMLVVCGRRSSDNRIVCRRNELTGSVTAPFNNSNWQTAVVAPALPDNWQFAGDPAVADSTKFINAVTVVTRATKSGQAARIYYNTYRWDNTFHPNWGQIPTGTVSITSDPALSFDWTLPVEQLLTLVHRGSNQQLYEGSGFAAGWIGNGWEDPATTLIDAVNSSNFGFTSAAPAIAGNLNGWEGEHLMVGVRQVGQPATNQYFSTSPPQVQ